MCKIPLTQLCAILARRLGGMGVKHKLKTIVLGGWWGKTKIESVVGKTKMGNIAKNEKQIRKKKENEKNEKT